MTRDDLIPDSGLPVEESVPALRAALAGAGQAVLQAPPGAGKTTVVPLRLLDESWLAGGRIPGGSGVPLRIVMLEPRRLATRAAARRMAALLGEDVGATVGYRTRDERRTGPATRIEVVTEGILTRRLQHDPSLPGVGLVIFDEFHERNLHADLALALTLDARPALRPDLRLLVMSATLDTGRVAALLGSAASGDGGPAPVIVSEGRAWPVDIRFVPPAPPARKAGYKGRPGPPPRPGSNVAAAATAAVLRALREERGDVLVFLPGAGDIRRVEAALTAPGSGLPDGVDLRPLYGALAAADQDAALAPSPPGRRRVVLATDIAETSLTVDGVRVVVDGGWHRSPRFDPRSGLTRLETVPITKASADQRAGRAGRTEPGVAYRLWSKLEHAARRPVPRPRDRHRRPRRAGPGAGGLGCGGRTGSGAAVPRPASAPGRSKRAGACWRRWAPSTATAARPPSDGPWPTCRCIPAWPAWSSEPSPPAGAGPPAPWPPCWRSATCCGGGPTSSTTDVGVRLRLLVDRAATFLLAAIRRPTARPWPPPAAGPASWPAGSALRRPARTTSVDPGPVLALAYPDRIAQARGGARFRLRGGGGAWLRRRRPAGRRGVPGRRRARGRRPGLGRRRAATAVSGWRRPSTPPTSRPSPPPPARPSSASPRCRGTPAATTSGPAPKRRLDNLVLGETGRPGRTRAGHHRRPPRPGAGHETRRCSAGPPPPGPSSPGRFRPRP